MENNKRPDEMQRITNKALANAFIDEQIEESLKTLRKIVKENDGVPTTTPTV